MTADIQCPYCGTQLDYGQDNFGCGFWFCPREHCEYEVILEELEEVFAELWAELLGDDDD